MDSWLDYWKKLDESKQAAYVEKWNPPDDWRGYLKLVGKWEEDEQRDKSKNEPGPLDGST